MFNFRSPVVIRAVTCVVLMVSDIDCVFALLFIRNLIETGEGIFKFLSIVVVVGILTYFAAVTYVGPLNKTKIVPLLQDMMGTSPESFNYSIRGTSGRVSADDYVDPSWSRIGEPPKKFVDLEATEEDMAKMKRGLCEYGCVSVLVAAEGKIAKNTCDRAHGVPFYRLANFGFVAEPHPRDLGGILNANAAWTFAVGIQQLIYGAWMLYLEVHDMGAIQAMTVVPFVVSFVSLILSILNLVLDFSKILSDLDAETTMRDLILTQNQAEIELEKKKIKEKLKEDETAIKSGYVDPDVFAREEMNGRLDTARMECEIVLQKLDNDNLITVTNALNRHRRFVEGVRNAISGRLPERKEPPVEDKKMEEYRRAEAKWDKDIATLERNFEQERAKIDPQGENYVEELGKFEDKRAAKLKSLIALKERELRGIKNPGIHLTPATSAV